jgi:hypothetical protein
MASKSQVEANRRNAARSTGPKTARGRSRSAQNARSHGLSIPIADDPAASREMKELAGVVAGDTADPRRREQADIFAETQALLDRISLARVSLINRVLKSKPALSPEFEAAALVESLKELARLERYESSAMARRARAIRLING